MDKDLESKIRDITEFVSVSLGYGLIWSKNVEDLVAGKESAEHGESPLWKTFFDKQRDMLNNEKYIDYIPVFEHAKHLALVDFVVENNRKLLEIVQDLISQRS